MTAQQTYRFGHIDPNGPFQDGVTVTVVDDDATVLTLRGWTEPGRSRKSGSTIVTTAALGPPTSVKQRRDQEASTASGHHAQPISHGHRDGTVPAARITRDS